MASLHELQDMPNKGNYFLSFNNLLKVICDTSIKHKFSFKTPYKDKKQARYKCANASCLWSVIAHLNAENKNKIIINTINP